MDNIGQNKLDQNEIDQNKLDQNKLDQNEIDQNEIDQNKLDKNEIDKKKLKNLKVNSFHSIYIMEKSLILCDIDDTVLRYQYNLDYFMKKCKDNLIRTNNYIDTCDIKIIAECEFDEHREDTEPLHTDKSGFDSMIEKITQTNSELIFITARGIKSKEKTLKQLEKIGIDPNKFPIHFILDHKIPKSEYIKNHIDLSTHTNIYFIDDQLNNVKNVKITFPNFNCYYFKYN